MMNEVNAVNEVAPVKKKLPVWAIILIILGVLALCICVVVPAVLALLGPAVGNVFSNIQETIQP
jgi:hypothetical protein